MEADANLLLLSSDVYWEQDAEFRFIRFSGANQTWVDSLCKRAIGTRPWDMPYFNMSAQDWDEFRLCLAERQPFRDRELARLDEGGRVRWISVSGPSRRFHMVLPSAPTFSATSSHSPARAAAPAPSAESNAHPTDSRVMAGFSSRAAQLEAPGNSPRRPSITLRP